jgi:hypothetical protein
MVFDENLSKRNRNTDFLVEAKFGIFVHYLYGLQNSDDSRRKLSLGKSTSWDECVHDFNVKTFADTAAEAGAGYVIFTLMQQYRYMCAPNHVYDGFTGFLPGEACSTRDLVMDLYEALGRNDIKLMLYSTGEGPAKDEKAAAGIPWTGKPDVLFQSRWYGCMKEYSDTYKEKISGWWIDGCYPWWDNDSANLANYSAHLKSGNPKAIVAFNRGVEPIGRYVTADDYTCGERVDLDYPCEGRWVDDCQWHCLTFLGDEWAFTNTKYTDRQVIEYVKAIKANQGAITFDVGVYRDGNIAPEQVKQLISVRKEAGSGDLHI